MRDKTRALEVQGAKVGLKDQCHQDKVNAYWYQTWRCVSVPGGRIKEVDEFYGSIASKKGETDEDIQARIGKARQTFAMLRPIW